MIINMYSMIFPINDTICLPFHYNNATAVVKNVFTV